VLKIDAFLLAALLFSAPARAAETLALAPPAPWITLVPAPNQPSRDPNSGIQTLLLNEQDRLGLDYIDSFSEVVNRIQTAQGLSDIGSIGFAWNPATETPVVNRLTLRRGATTIDLLAAGQHFTILRRETNLERAALDGVLTAALQPEGLQIGDVIDFAFTITRRDPLLLGHGESLFVAPLALHPDRLLLREVWALDKSVRWKAGEDFATPKTGRTPGGEEFVIDMRNVDPPPLPAGAPPRYAAPQQVQATDFSTWNEVARLLAPLYEKAATLPADAAMAPKLAPDLAHEIAAIVTASSDPKQRAAAALRLVQEKIRYLFLGMAEGGLVPADAATTWARRFGDCKGKTALLLALLHKLGIEAVPALVSTGQGDGLDKRLPAIGLFDHVIVRTTIGGHVYWLDGTRLGDNALDTLAVPPYHWALPLTRATKALEPLYGPAISLRRTGAKNAAQNDLAAARKLQPDIDKEFGGYGVKP